MPALTTLLWFVDRAEEAAAFYVSLLPGSRIETVTRFGSGGPGPADAVRSVSFTVAGQSFVALNGGAIPGFKFGPAMSFAILCETQDEIDRLWERLLEGGGKPRGPGSVEDRFGLTWQVVPHGLGKILSSRAGMMALVQMSKLDIATLRAAIEE